ncbi:MAG: tyrosine--tRNA ligase [Alphaproteobacteria bacterium]|nr:tyrosine--tRNA ligase [Alphaproteobacteria bacterium]
MKKNEFIHELEQRGLIYQSTDLDGLNAVLNAGPVVGYLGSDPTADALHVGHLVPVMIMRLFQKYGNKPIMLVGGATGRIGDPSDRNSDRPMLSDADVEKNSAGLRKCYEQFIKFGDGATDAMMVDNYDWQKKYSHLDFLREFGTAFTMSQMLAMESVKMRLANGMSFLEFNYMPLQAVDFLHLFDAYGCNLQLCGADQWGNSVAGVSLIRQKRHKEAFVLSTPLITDSNGVKIGKSMGNAVWVRSDRTSPYEYYQYFRNTMDGDVEKFLKIFTELPLVEIAKLSALRDAEINEAKKILAFEATKIAHGEMAANDAQNAAAALFAGGADSDAIPTTELVGTQYLALTPVIDFTVAVELFPSKSEARRAIEQGGLQIDGVKITDISATITPAKSHMLQKGKKTFLRVIIK